MKKVITEDGIIKIAIEKSEAHFSRAYDKNRTDDFGIGKYALTLSVTALKEAVYIPVSIASGRKSTGLIYHIEGTAGGVATVTISSKGEGIATVTSGSISYCKIPVGKTASFKILAQVTGALGKEYKIVVSRINYKLNPNDLRYRRFLTEIPTEALKFR